MSLKIVLADDHQLVRNALRALLEHDPVAGIDIVGEASTGQEVLECLMSVAPDIVVMDWDMPDMNGVETTKRLRYLRPNTKVIALSVHGDKKHVKQMLDAGASSYIVKAAAGKELFQAIEAVSSGRTYFCPEVSDALVEAVCDQRKGSGAVLGARELEVLKLLADGLHASEIAERMRITPSTVETHRRNIMRKLDLHTIVELTKYAIREGLSEA